MKYKRQSKLQHGVEMLGLGSIKSVGDVVTIEGLANKYVLDRGNDIIELDAWQLDNYKKNPVILFNHGMDPVLGGTPIGKAVEVKPTEEGLYIKVEISNVDDPVINRIRGLVKERILRAFSVGFDPKAMVTDSEDRSVNRIKQAELFEVSIVGVPMNQDSLFELTGKMIKRKSLKMLKKDILNRKGAMVAAAAQARMDELEKEGVNKDDVLEKIAEMCQIDMEDLLKILAGEVTPVPKECLEAMSEVLSLPLEELEELNSGDEEEEEAEEEAEEAEEVEEVEAEEPEAEEVEEKSEEEEEEESSEEGKQLEEKAEAIGAANTESENEDTGNPQLDAAKQTNILLSTLINEIQLMSRKLDQVVAQPVEEQTSSKMDEMEEQESEEEKALKSYSLRIKGLQDRLDKLLQDK